MTILVIEDHLPQRKLANRVLGAAGNHVIDAEAAEEAFMAIKKGRPEVILLDLALFRMDGLTLVRKLKADADTRDIPVIAVTAFPEMFSKADALAAGCDAYLLKPLSTRTLPDEINAVVTRQRNEPRQ